MHRPGIEPGAGSGALKLSTSPPTTYQTNTQHANGHPQDHSQKKWVKRIYNASAGNYFFVSKEQLIAVVVEDVLEPGASRIDL
jgi:hypothetical protein